MNVLLDSVIDVANKDDVYENIMQIYNSKKIVNDGGSKKTEIKHGDYGYFPHEGTNIPRLFLKTSRGKIEAFCTKQFHHKCAMGADVNENPQQYFICGNIFE